MTLDVVHCSQYHDISFTLAVSNLAMEKQEYSKISQIDVSFYKVISCEYLNVYVNLYFVKENKPQVTVSGGSRISRWGGGRQPPTCTLFGENVCENERN